jgi:hypothetical protein
MAASDLQQPLTRCNPQDDPMIDISTSIALIVVIFIIMMKSVRIAHESERFAVFMLGRFHSYQGPGLVMIIPFTQRVHKLTVGDVGVLTGSATARFDTVGIPIRDTRSLRHGQAVRIDGFDGVEPKVVASSVSAKAICPNCGHKF